MDHKVISISTQIFENIAQIGCKYSIKNNMESTQMKVIKYLVQVSLLIFIAAFLMVAFYVFWLIVRLHETETFSLIRLFEDRLLSWNAWRANDHSTWLGASSSAEPRHWNANWVCNFTRPSTANFWEVRNWISPRAPCASESEKEGKSALNSWKKSAVEIGLENCDFHFFFLIGCLEMEKLSRTTQITTVKSHPKRAVFADVRLCDKHEIALSSADKLKCYSTSANGRLREPRVDH